MKLVNKDALLTEIEDIESTSICEFKSNQSRYAEGSLDVINRIKSFLDTLEVKEVDLEKEIQRQYNVYKNPDNSIVKDCVIMTEDGFEYFAKHFFELGLKAQNGE